MDCICCTCSSGTGTRTCTNCTCCMVCIACMVCIVCTVCIVCSPSINGRIVCMCSIGCDCSASVVGGYIGGIDCIWPDGVQASVSAEPIPAESITGADSRA